MADALRRLYGMARRNDGTLGWFALIFVHSFAIQSSPLLLQFASKRLEWTLARAGYLLSIRAVCAVVVLVVLVPAANLVVGRKARHPRQDGIDILVCRLTLFLLAVGNVIIGFSTSAISIILGMFPALFGPSNPLWLIVTAEPIRHNHRVLWNPVPTSHAGHSRGYSPARGLQHGESVRRSGAHGAGRGVFGDFIDGDHLRPRLASRRRA